MPQIQEQPSLEDESIDSLEDMRRKGVNNISLDFSQESEHPLQTEEIKVVDKSRSKPSLKEKVKTTVSKYRNIQD